MSTDDVWKAPESESANPFEEAGLAADPLEGGSDDPVDVPRAVWADLTAHPLPYVMANVGYMAGAMVVVTLILLLVAVPVLPGVLMDDETVMMVGLFVGFSLYMVTLLGFAFLVIPLWTASMIRGIDRQRKGLGTIGLMSSFNDMRPRAGAVIGCYLLTQALAFIGMLFFYLPGFVAMAVGGFALPIVIFEDVGPVEAWKRAWHHVKNHASWHVAVFAMMFAAIITLEFTVVGLLFIWPLMTAWQLFAYRLAFGEKGSQPVPA